MQDAVLEFEIDEERHLDSVLYILERPIRVHMPKRSIQIFGVDLLLIRPQDHTAAEAFAEHLETDHQIGQHFHMIAPVFTRPDARRRCPRQEFWVIRNVRDKIIHLLRRVRQGACFGMCWHLLFCFDRDSGGGCRIVRAKNQGKPMSERPYVIDEMISAKAIAARIEELSNAIKEEFRDTNKLVVVGLLRGSFVFIADLVRELDLPVEVDFLEASSYGDAMESSREVRILKDLRGQIEGRDVLVVEDIVDTGHTLKHVVGLLESRNPGRLRTIALLDKPSRRETDVAANWIGFSIPDEFVVGYGIDYAQRNRNLPYIGKVRFP